LFPAEPVRAVSLICPCGTSHADAVEVGPRRKEHDMSGRIAWRAGALVSSLALIGASAGAGTAGRCAATKERVAARTAAALASCAARAVARATTVDPGCTSAAHDSFARAWALAESRGGCVTTGDQDAIESKVDAFSLDLDDRLQEGAPASRCSAAKFKDASRDVVCELGCTAHAAAHGLAASDGACRVRCAARLQNAFRRDEVRGDCHTTGDAASVAAVVAGFADDVHDALTPSAPTTTSTQLVTTTTTAVTTTTAGSPTTTISATTTTHSATTSTTTTATTASTTTTAGSAPTTTSSATSSTTTTTVATLPGGLFEASNPWNSSVATHPKSGASDTIIGALAAAGGWGGGTMRIDFSIELMTGDASTPFQTFTTTGDFYTPDCDHVPFPVPPGGALEGESGYQCAGDGDCHLLVVHPPTKTLYEMWRANIVGTNFQGGCAAVWDLTRSYPSNLRGEGCTSADAGGFPIAAMLFSADEVASGAIAHAIRFILPNSRIRNNVYVHPGTHSTGATSGGPNLPPYGVRLRLRADFPLASLPSDGARVVARALQSYGMFLADGGTIALTAQSDRFTSHKWANVGVDSRSLQAIQVSDMEVVDLGTPINWNGDCVRNP
jgi:hypothetical protein